MRNTKQFDQGSSEYRLWKQRTLVRRTLECGFFAPFWDDLALFLLRRGYSWHRTRNILRVVRRYVASAEAAGVNGIADLTDERAVLYFKGLPPGRKQADRRRFLSLLRIFFVESGLQDERRSAVRESPPIVGEFLAYQREHRGLAPRTTRGRRPHVEALVHAVGKGDGAEFHALTGLDVQRFIVKRAAELTPSQRKEMCAALRSFLRFLFVRGYAPVNLADAVPTIPSFGLARVPKGISTEAIQRILASIDRSTGVGLRDYAMLLTLATYGIRGGQLVSLRLDDIDWRRQQIRVRGTKGGRDVTLPLQPAAGEAIVAYLRHGRPVGWPFREVFLSDIAPVAPLQSHLAAIIKRRATKVGIQLPSFGGHAWRFACATRMLAGGQSLKHIRDILGHASIETTFIYTKVDLGGLRKVAMEWPEVAS